MSQQSKSLIDEVFGPNGLFETVFGSTTKTKKELPPKPDPTPTWITPSITKFHDLKSCEFRIDDTGKRIAVYCKGRVSLVNLSNNTKANFGDLWLILQDATLVPKTGWAFDLVHPNYSHLSLYLGHAKEGDEDLLKTYLHLKKQLKA